MEAWLEAHRHEASLTVIMAKLDELETAMEPIMRRLRAYERRTEVHAHGCADTDSRADARLIDSSSFALPFRPHSRTRRAGCTACALAVRST